MPLLRGLAGESSCRLWGAWCPGLQPQDIRIHPGWRRPVFPRARLESIFRSTQLFQRTALSVDYVSYAGTYYRLHRCARYRRTCSAWPCTLAMPLRNLKNRERRRAGGMNPLQKLTLGNAWH